jgi:photosystem II stability/assembly factor-like uncharacterized protein
MGTQLIRIIQIVSLLLAVAVLPARAQEPLDSDATHLPFTLSWTQGHCHRCKTATLLTDVQFVSQREAWGTGFAPPGETGTGDTTIVHTRDGGKTWTEFPSSYEHNSSPHISFANQREGWVMTVQMPEGEQRLLQTRDGGAHWRRLSLRDLFVDDIQYLGDGFGYATRFDIYSKSGQWVATKDYGRHWVSSSLPEGFWPDKVAFANRSDGMLTGCVGQNITVLATIDGGHRWIVSSIDLPADTTTDPHCEFSVADLSVIDARHAWLLATKQFYKSGEALTPVSVVLRTSNGGVTWAPVFPAMSPLRHAQLTSVQFLDDRLGIITGVEGLDMGKAVPAGAEGILLYTVDGGENWQKMNLPRPVWGCRRLSGGLACAGEEGFWVLKISLGVPPRNGLRQPDMPRS